MTKQNFFHPFLFLLKVPSLTYSRPSGLCSIQKKVGGLKEFR